MGYFFGNLLEETKSMVVGLIVAVAFAVTSGLSPTLPQVRQYPPLEAIWFLSYPRWGAESIYLKGFVKNLFCNQWDALLQYNGNPELTK